MTESVTESMTGVAGGCDVSGHAVAGVIAGAIVGSTASGKSSVAHALALALGDVEIVSMDSMQVYRGMDIGTAKPTLTERQEVTYHLIDLADPHESFTLGRFQRAYRNAIADVAVRGRRALLVGGTGLYLRAAIDDFDLPGNFPIIRAELEADPDTAGLFGRLNELDPLAASRMEPTNRRRIVRALEVCVGSGQPFSSFGPGLEEHPPLPFEVVGLRWQRPVLDQRIRQRYERQIDEGFVDEVRGLLADGRSLSSTAAQALGYKELAEHIAGRLTLPEALELSFLRTRQFARRQERWFRRDPRIRWIDANPPEVNPPDAYSVDLLPRLLREWARCD